jgi:replication factor A1
MKISDLVDGARKVDIEAMVVEKEESRDINTKFGQTKVANAVIEDETGKFKLVLWGDHADLVKAGNKIRITNGFITSFRDEQQLSIGKFGKLEII